VEVKRPTMAQAPLTHTLAVRLDAETIDTLAAIGASKGVGPSTLARMWLIERLASERQAHGARRTRSRKT
jgi:hypothetical protein